MEHKTSAHYQRLHRQRLREQGLVKKEVWILPEHSPLLQRLEKQMLEHARNLEFEQAARVRDQLALLKDRAFGAHGGDVLA